MLESQISSSCKIAVKLETWMQTLESFASQRFPIQSLRHIPENTLDDIDVLWFVFSCLVLALQGGVFMLIIFPFLEIWKVAAGKIFVFVVIYMCIHHLLLVYVAVVYRYAPYRCLGSIGKLVVEVITLSAPMLLREVLEYNLLYLLMLLGFTADVHIFARFMHVAYDVDVWDTVQGLLMQLLVYPMGWNMLISIVVFMFCFGLIFYRYWDYKPPDIPLDTKKDLDKLLC